MDIPETGFIANVNSVADNIDTIKAAATLFDISTVAILNEIAAIDLDLVIKDLQKGTYLGNRKIDIDLSLNNTSLTTLVSYQQANVLLKDGTLLEIPFVIQQQDLSWATLELTSHADIKNYITTSAIYLASVINTEATVQDAIGSANQLIRFTDSDGVSSNIDRVDLIVYAGSAIETTTQNNWSETTSSLQTLSNRASDIILLGQSISDIIVLANLTDDISALSLISTELHDIFTNLTTVIAVGNSLAAILSVNTNTTNINTLATNIADLQNIATAIIPNLTEILLADSNAIAAGVSKDQAAGSAVTAADEAANSAIYAAQALDYVNQITSLTTTTTTLTAGSPSTSNYNPITGILSLGLPQGIKGDTGAAFTVDALGTLAARATYDDAAIGFAYLAVDNSNLYFKQSITTADWSAGVPFGKGDQGDQGIQGLGWLSGSGVPSDAAGIDGEFYINSANGDVYTKASGTWGVPAFNLAAAINDSTVSAILAWSSNKITNELALKSSTTHNHTATYEPKNANIQSHIINLTNPHGVTKAQVGLSNVDNTTDAGKPVSTAQQTALDLKVNNTQVLTDVPAGAVFTDTVYVHPNEGVDMGVALTGANVLSDVTVNAKGHVTGFTARALTAANIGALAVAATAATAYKWLTARTLSLSGNVTGSVAIDGSGDVNIVATVVGFEPVDATLVRSASGITDIWTGTQAAYDLLTPDANTLYFIQ